MKQKSLKINAVLSFVKAFMNLAFPLISFPYASRILMPEGIGLVNFANAIVDYFLVLAGLGINAYGTREAAKIRDDQQKLNKFSREMLCISLTAMVVSYVLFFLVLCFHNRLAEYKILFCVCATKILFHAIGMEWLYNAKEEYSYITFRSVFFQILSLIFLFSFVHTPDDYIKYAMMGVLSSVGSNIFNIIHASKYISVFERHPIEIKKHLKGVFIFFGLNFAPKVTAMIDSVMLGFLASYSFVGYYTAANKVTVMVVGLLSAVLLSFMPRCTFYYGKKMMAEYHTLVHTTVQVALFFAVPLFVGIFLLSEPIIVLLSGKQYLQAVLAMRILCPQILFNITISVVHNTILSPQGKEKYMLISQSVAGVLNCVLNFLLIPHFYVNGAALATLLSQGIYVCMVMYYARDTFITKNLLVHFVQVVVASMLMFGAIVFVNQFIHGGLLITLVVSIATGMAVYAFITFFILKNKTAMMLKHTLQGALQKR